MTDIAGSRRQTRLIESSPYMGKRLLDVVLGTGLALAFLPFVLVLAGLLAMSVRAWPIFVQRRIGKHGREFNMVKLRTLPRSVDPYMLKTDLHGVRISRLAKWTRRHHLDELPQLFLVPLGRLSLVGPRPKMPDDVEAVDADYGASRVQVAQGCSGLWQIGRHKGDLPHEAPEYDYFYLRHMSLALDLWIIWKTAAIMLRVSKPIAIDDIPKRLLREGSPRGASDRPNEITFIEDPSPSA